MEPGENTASNPTNDEAKPEGKILSVHREVQRIACAQQIKRKLNLK